MYDTQNKKQIGTYKEETEKMRAEIEDFRHSMKTIQAAKCSICHGQLDLPAGMNESVVGLRSSVFDLSLCVKMHAEIEDDENHPGRQLRPVDLSA